MRPEFVLNSSLDRPVLVATITLLPSAESGNASPVFSGWRALLRYDGDDESTYHGTEIRFDTVSKIAPEETANCIIRLFYPEYHADRAEPNQSFVLMDGQSVRARGVIVDVLGMDTPSAG